MRKSSVVAPAPVDLSGSKTRERERERVPSNTDAFAPCTAQRVKPQTQLDVRKKLCNKWPKSGADAGPGLSHLTPHFCRRKKQGNDQKRLPRPARASIDVQTFTPAPGIARVMGVRVYAAVPARTVRSGNSRARTVRDNRAATLRNHSRQHFANNVTFTYLGPNGVENNENM